MLPLFVWNIFFFLYKSKHRLKQVKLNALLGWFSLLDCEKRKFI